MSLFDFLKDAGEKLSSETSEAQETADEMAKADAMTSQVRMLGLEVEDLVIGFDDGVVTVQGKAPTQEEKEKVILVLGNIQGVARVDDQLAVAQEAPAATLYTVKPGDSLSKIAKEHYGNAMKYPVIFEANQPMLKNPDRIYPGQVLRIPALES
jgi:nucleoid-associated protein YgaU